MKGLYIYLAIMNMIALIMMGIDKQRSVRHRWRIPERALFSAALLGGSLGELMGMWLFWHKIRNKLFAVGLPVLVMLHIVLLFVVNAML